MPTLEITTNIGCPVDCTFCPQPAITAAYTGERRMMSLDDFRTILAKVPKHVRIDFSGMAEPWANRDCTEMLRHTLQLGYRVAVYTTLIGMRDVGDVVSLLRSYSDQVDIVVIHLPDSSGNMRGFKLSHRYKLTLSSMLILGRSGVLKEFRMMAMGRALTAEAIAADEIDDFIGIDRAGALDLAAIGDQDAASVTHETPVGCSFTPFYDHNVVLPDGSVVLCCMDYGLKHVIGNLLTGDYWSLFSSPAMSALRVVNMQHGCDGSICKSCVRATRYEVTPESNQFWQIANT